MLKKATPLYFNMMETEIKSIIEVAKNYAITCHSVANQKYDNYLPYAFHLKMVVGNVYKFKHLVPEEKFEPIVMAAYLHDTLEDCLVTYNDIKSVCGTEVADIVFALTNEKGKNRKERASTKYYEGIVKTPYATFIKLCDRIANIEYGKMTAWEGGKMVGMYRKENPDFKSKLYDKKYDEMFNYIETLLK